MIKILRPHLFIFGLIFLMVFLVFGITLTHSFVSLDDYRHLHDNPALSQLTLENLKSIWSQAYFGMYAPVTYTFWSAVMTFSKWAGNGEISALIFHFSNLLLHAFDALLVYVLLFQLGLKRGSATIAALVFASHPVQVESIAWISSFRDLLATFWGLVFLNGLARSLSKNEIRFFRVSLLSFTLGLALLSKPSAVVFVGLALLCFYYVRKKFQKNDLLLVGLWGLVAIGVSIFAKSIQPDSSVDLVPSFFERILLTLQALSFYATKILWPVGLTPDYGLSPTHVLKTWSTEGYAFFTFALVSATLLTIVWFAVRKKPWALGLAFALIAIAPYSGLIIFNYQNISTVADRYLYVSMIGIAWSVASILATLHLRQKMMLVVGGAVVGALGLLSFQQSRVWEKDETLFTHMLQQNSRSFHAYGGLGNLLFMQGKANEALPLLQKAVELRPSYPQAVANIGRVLELQGKPHEALPKYIQAINIDPKFVGAYVSLADLLLRAGRSAEAKETVYHGFDIAPNSPELKAILADIEKQQQK